LQQQAKKQTALPSLPLEVGITPKGVTEEVQPRRGVGIRIPFVGASIARPHSRRGVSQR
jgi:hypothetical protein